MQSSTLSDTIRAVRGAFYMLGGAIIAMPFVDWARALFPLRIEIAGYRFAKLQMLSANLMTPLVGMGIIFLAAYLSESRRGVAVIRGLALTGVVVLVAIMLLFPFDVLQVRGETPPDLRTTVIDQAASFAMFRYGLAVAVLVGFFRAASRALRILPISSKSLTRPSVVVG